MPHKPRLNRLIELLEQEKPAFGAHVYNGNLDEITHAATAGYDFVFIENEHVGMDFSQLRVSLQFFLNRRNILDQGSLQANPTPLVRVAPNTGEMNQWVLKQTLDHGVYGVLLPKVESVEAGPRQRCSPAATHRSGAQITLGASEGGAPVRLPAIGASPYRNTMKQPASGPWMPTARSSSWPSANRPRALRTCPIFFATCRALVVFSPAPAIYPCQWALPGTPKTPTFKRPFYPYSKPASNTAYPAAPCPQPPKN